MVEVGLFPEVREKKMEGCRKCPIYTKQRVPPQGDVETATLVVVGEAPGMTEVKEGIPFCGRSGRYLREILEKVGFDLSKMYVLNAVQCHPEDEFGRNRTPRAEEIEACRPNLIAAIRRVKNRRLVLLLGSVALRAVLGKNGINKYHGLEEWSEELNCPVFVTYHPAAVIRDIRKADAFVNDLSKAYAIFTSRKREEVRFVYPKTLGEVDSVLASLGDTVAFDTETTGISPFKEGARVLFLSFSDGKTTVVIPLSYTRSPFSKEEQEELFKRIQKFFASNRTFIAHNGKFDTLWLSVVLGIEASFVFDTKIAQYLLNELADTGLKRMAAIYTNLGNYALEVEDHIEDLESLPEETLLRYSATDAYATYRIYERLREEIKNQGLSNTLRLVTGFAQSLREVEKAGVLVDQEALQCIRETLEKRQSELLGEMRRTRTVQRWEETTGKIFNPNSGHHLREIFYDILNLPILAYTKKTKQPATDFAVIRELSKYHELPRLLLLYTKVKKLISTYVEDFRRNITPDGKIHSSFNLTTTVTGRLSSSNPNLQNIPAREGIAFIKRIFIPQPSWVLLNFDYSQIELRVLAAMSRDENLCQAYREGKDIHTYTAQRIFGKEEVSKEERQYAKSINFGLVYGMSPVGLSRRIGVTEKEANDFMKEYFRQYPGVKEYIEAVQKEVLQKGYVRSPFGRYRRFFQEQELIRSGVLDEGEQLALTNSVMRKAVNFTIQSTASDITQLALYRIVSTFKRLGLRSRVILTVHDSILVESPWDEVEEVVPIVQGIMENLNLSFLSVPLQVEVEIGLDYFDMVPYQTKEEVLSQIEEKFTPISELPRIVEESLEGLMEEFSEDE